MIEITPPEGLTDPGKIHHEIAPTPSVVREIKGYFTENPEEGQFPDTEIERLRTIHQDDQEAAAME